jgi:hypothetical protein
MIHNAARTVLQTLYLLALLFLAASLYALWVVWPVRVWWGR